MLAIRIVDYEEPGDGFPDFCSLCGKPATDYLITPWDHINVCRDCMSDFLAFGHAGWQLMREGGSKLPTYRDFIRRPKPPQATSS